MASTAVAQPLKKIVGFVIELIVAIVLPKNIRRMR